MAHPIFAKPYSKYWGILAALTIVFLYFFGFPKMEGYEGYGYIFWTIGSLFCALVFGSILYLVYRMIFRKWNNNAFMICIAIMWLAYLILCLKIY